MKIIKISDNNRLLTDKIRWKGLISRNLFRKALCLGQIVLLIIGCTEGDNYPKSDTKEVVQKSNVSQLINETKQKQAAKVLFEQGNDLLQAQKYSEAIELYNRALAIKPNYDRVWVNHGNALTALQQYEKAIASYETAIKYNPQMEEAWYNRGNALSSLQRYHQAIASYTQAIKIQPQKHEAWINKGIALAKIQKYQQAIAAYDQAIHIKPNQDLAYYNKACAYALQNQPEQAIINLQTAIQLAPGKYTQLAQTDGDFHQIRNHPKFQALLKGIK